MVFLIIIIEWKAFVLVNEMKSSTTHTDLKVCV
jgi:hypothetical protein